MSSRPILKGTFGHVNSRVHRPTPGRSFTFNRTFSDSSSGPANPDGLYSGEPSSNTSTCSHVHKDSGVEIDPAEPNPAKAETLPYFDMTVDFSSNELPSDLVDVEGNLMIRDKGLDSHRSLQFGQDDEDGLNSSVVDEPSSSSSLPKRDSLKDSNVCQQRSIMKGSLQNSSVLGKGVGDPLPSKSKSIISNGKFPLSFRNPHHLLRRSVIEEFPASQLRRHKGGPGGGKTQKLLGDRKNSLSESSSAASTITQHYYPEGGWGFVVLLTAALCHCLVVGIHSGGTGILICMILRQYGIQEVQLIQAAWLGATSVGLSLLLSPIWVSICKRKSTRLAAVFGGLIASLGCLFTSFATQFHQLFISYGGFIGVGVGLTRDASSLMVGQYFKRKRELVEIIVVAGSGLGILLMSISIRAAISILGWRIGLQAITGALFLTFFLGSCYRSASLYHPQRRAILHLKNQKRKVKEKEKRDDKPPFLDFTCLRSKTLQILLFSSGLTAFGINTPLFYLAVEYDKEIRTKSKLQNSEGESNQFKDEFSFDLLHAGVGTAWILGCFLFGLIVVQKNQDCRISKQYLCQMAGVICGISIVALTVVEGFNGLIIFSVVYGFSLGGYNYALKVYTYERVRARHFPRAWSFIQSAQAIPLFFGVPLTGYMNNRLASKAGYYISALSVIFGSLSLFLTDVRRRRLSRRKAQNSSMKTSETLESAQSPKIRRLSFAFPVEQQLSPQFKPDSVGNEAQGTLDPALLAKELTCISEEGIADMDFQDIYFEEWAEYFGGDCITSCNKVENCLVSECEPDYAVLLDRKSRRWSVARPNLAHATSAVAGCIAGLGPTAPSNLATGVGSTSGCPRSPSSRSQAGIGMTLPPIPSFKSNQRPPRTLPGIDEAEPSVSQESQL